MNEQLAIITQNMASLNEKTVVRMLHFSKSWSQPFDIIPAVDKKNGCPLETAIKQKFKLFIYRLD